MESQHQLGGSQQHAEIISVTQGESNNQIAHPIVSVDVESTDG